MTKDKKMKVSFRRVSIIGFLIVMIQGICSYSSAQNVNFSQYQLTPTTTNPGMIGSFAQYQGLFNYRSQSNGGETNFQTMQASIIIPILNRNARRIKGQRIGGFAVNASQDVAGDDGLLTTQGVGGGFAYNIKMDIPGGWGAFYDAYLSFGGHVNYFQRSVNVDAIQTGSQFVNGAFDPNTDNGEAVIANSISYLSFSAGAYWYFLDGQSGNMRGYMGASASNLNQPNIALLEGETNQLPMAYTAILGWDIWTSYDGIFSFEPNARWIKQGNSSQINAGALVHYRLLGLEPGRDTDIYIGGWYSTTNGAIATLGVNHKNVVVGASIDLGSLGGASTTSQSIELSVGLKFGQKSPNLSVIEDLYKEEESLITLENDDLIEVDKEEEERVMTNQKEELTTDEEAVLNEIILFDPLNYELTSESKTILNEVVDILLNHPNAKIIIEGHADDVYENKEENNQLSLDRALVVREYLHKKGVSISRLKTAGYGDTKPIVANDSDENRAKNRRVSFQVVE